MSNRHSYVAFYMDRWMGGTARMPRIVESVLFRLSLYTWDKCEAVPAYEVEMMNSDLENGQGAAIVDVLVKSGKLIRNDDGSVYSPRAMEEATKAFELWQKKSKGGKAAHAKTADKTPDDTSEESSDDSRKRIDKTREEVSKKEGKPSSSENSDVSGEQSSVPPVPAAKPKPAPVNRSEDVQAVGDAWNAMASKNGLGQIKKMTEERRKKVRARLDDYPLAEIVEAINLIPHRPFCMGKAGGRGWKADFEFLIRPDSVTKLREGGAYQGNDKGGSWLDA